ncbi:TRAFAC clade GTPase domain-containing protein [Sorangium sp. So ce1182]|uniref:TRAFAC clade GTPase domain-containing protein n=1 Tax=Sorangium sp. So ce1182 TaxID=3133334 RepID=UPI003F5E9C8B
MADAIATEAKEKETATPTAVAKEPAFVDLFAGTAMSAADAEAVTLRSPVQLIVFAGAEGSGKTTVLASIYERLSQGPFAGFNFSGSRSLIGFEEICHLNRLASGSVQPETQRTVPTEEATYYHLALTREKAGRQRHHVLLSAVSGELFRLAKNSREDCARLTFLHRADAIVVLVDGARLAAPESRENAIADASGILSSFVDAEMLDARARVDFVFSKLDLVIAAGQSAENVLPKTQAKLEAKFRTRVPGLRFRRIAARPDASSSADMKDGLAEAFASWTEPKQPAARETWLRCVPPNNAREFSKFGWRYFERVGRDTP